MDGMPGRAHRHLVVACRPLPDVVLELLRSQVDPAGGIPDEEVEQFGGERGIGSELRVGHQADWEHPFQGRT